MSMIVCDNCGIYADSDYGDCVFGDVHSFCSEECQEKFGSDIDVGIKVHNKLKENKE
jgi:hypothetical protein